MTIASYKLAALGYGVGMALSVAGELPAGLLFITTTGILAAALFLIAGVTERGPR